MAQLSARQGRSYFTPSGGPFPLSPGSLVRKSQVQQGIGILEFPEGLCRCSHIVEQLIKTVWLSGVVKLARRQRGRKNALRVLENWSTTLRGPSAT